MSGRVTAAVTAGVATIVLDNPGQRNALTPEMLAGLGQQIEDPQRRMSAFDDMMYNLRPMEKDEYRADAPARHEAFRQWLDNPDVPEEWKRPWVPFLKDATARTSQ